MPDSNINDELENDEDQDNIDDDDGIIIVPVIPEEPVVFFGTEINAVLFEMIMGIIIYGLACQVIIIWFVSEKLDFSMGLWAGILIAIGYSAHLWWSIGRYLYMGTYAAGLSRKHMLFRYLIVTVMLVWAAVAGLTQFLAAVLGIFGIKAGAFMQPLLRKILKRGNLDG
ncbi:MAG: hypothetical protein FWG91_06690 [Lachnospiraceae bacterium]|nr:hypothetical protein [Lachnospiraceae bacterium]